MRNALVLSGVFILVLALCGVWMVAQFRAEVRDDIDAQLAHAHLDLSQARYFDVQAWFQDQGDVLFFTESYRTADGRVLGALRPKVFDREGYQTLSSKDLFQPRYFTDLDQITSEFDTTNDDALSLQGETWRVFVGPLDGGQLAVFEPISGVEEALDIIPRVMLTVGGALVITTLLAGVLMAWRQQARLDHLRAGIARIGQGDLSHPMAPRHMRDDLDEIMVGVDAAAAQLEGSISRLRLFSQNVAHELRTPLARLRATLEDNPDTPQAALDRTDDVIRILNAVQRIARLSHQPAPDSLSPVPLADVVTLIQDLFTEVAIENGQFLHVDLKDPAIVQGDFQLLVQMLSNLVENAIKHAGAGAEITIRADRGRLSVRDTGAGITSELDLTEPFARAPEAQAREGSGLGLALVKTIATYHGATFNMTSDGGVNVLVMFPATPP